MNPRRIDNGCVAIFIFALLIAFARMPERMIYGYMWAEDGRVFLEQAYHSGARSLFIPYAQYFHLIPRAIALTYAKLGAPEHAARPFMWAATTVLCGACAYLYSFAARTLPAAAAAVFALAPILVPSGGEVWLTLTNIQWVIAPVLLVMLWDELHTATPAKVVAIVAMTLTGPFGLMFSPIVVAEVVIRRTVARRAWLGIALYFLACIAQLASILTHPEPATPKDQALRAAAATYVHYDWAAHLFRDVVLGFAFPHAWVDRLGDHWPIAAYLCLFAMAVCVAAARRPYRWAAAVLIGIAFALWAVGVVRCGTPQTTLTWDGAGSRYFFVPFVMTTWALVLCAAHPSRPIVRFVSVFILSCAALNSAAELKCFVQPPNQVVYIDGQRQLFIPPGGGWNVNLPVK